MAKIKTIEEMYQKYLDLNKLDVSQMHHSEIEGRKTSFMAGMAMMFNEMAIEIPKVADDDICVEELDKLQKQLLDYWMGKGIAFNMN